MLDRMPPFVSAPSSCQFAKNGLWERAWSFPSDRLPTRAELLAYLAQSTEVAFEAFFGRSFFGARVVGSVEAVETFSMKCLQAARAQEGFFDVFRAELGCPVADQPPDFAEIGCVDAWRSVGAIRISRSQLASTDFDPLWRSLQDTAANRDTRHAKAIEFAFAEPIPHWFGVPVSAPDERNAISERLLRQAIGLTSRSDTG